MTKKLKSQITRMRKVEDLQAQVVIVNQVLIVGQVVIILALKAV